MNYILMNDAQNAQFTVTFIYLHIIHGISVYGTSLSVISLRYIDCLASWP